MMRRSFLFLQGPHGPFFAKLGSKLRQSGHNVLRINFTAGDWLDWHGDDAISYRGSLEEWPDWLRTLMRRQPVTDVVVYGDCRPLHQAAISMLRPLGVQVHVFEEGYFRPNWITLEAGGVNGNTAIPRDTEGIIARAEQLGWPARSGEPVGSTTGMMIRWCVRHYVARWAGSWLFPHYRTHRPVNSCFEALCWLARLPKRGGARKRANRHIERLRAAGTPFFLLPLQLDSDAQILKHSPFGSMADVLELVIESFARHAPADLHLLVKNHPLDCGATDYCRITARIAERYGVKARVIFLDGGHLPSLLSEARGCIVVNSTVGLQAIHHRCPTIALGTAIYALPGLVNVAPLAKFWSAPLPPNPKLYRAFRTVVIAHSQHNGSFYTEEGMALLLQNVITRLCGAEQRHVSPQGLALINEAAGMLDDLLPPLAQTVRGRYLTTFASDVSEIATLSAYGDHTSAPIRSVITVCNDLLLLSEFIVSLDAWSATWLAEACGLAAAIKRRLTQVSSAGTAPIAQPLDENPPSPSVELSNKQRDDLRVLLILVQHLREEIEQQRLGPTPRSDLAHRQNARDPSLPNTLLPALA